MVTCVELKEIKPMASSRVRLPATLLRETSAVSPIELFFDLVFVFALTQVTAAMAKDLTGTGVLQGMLVVALLWWCWTGYAWLGNFVHAGSGLVRMALLAARSSRVSRARG